MMSYLISKDQSRKLKGNLKMIAGTKMQQCFLRRKEDNFIFSHNRLQVSLYTDMSFYGLSIRRKY